MDQPIRLDIADQTGRNFGKADAALAAKLARRLRRKFGQTVRRESILEQALLFQDIYRFASDRLPECTRPSEDGYAHLSNVDGDRLAALLAQAFPQHEHEVLQTLCGWAIYYEYLR